MDKDGSASFNPFHAGELEAQRLAGVHVSHAPLRPFMPEQHRVFFSRLPYVVVATVDARGAPRATVLDGEPGFLTAPSPNRLLLRPRPDDRDPVRRLMVQGAPFGLLGIELPTRRRNRANGRILSSTDGWDLEVTQSFGNCPQYIHARKIVGFEAPGSAKIEILPELDEDALAQICAAGTFFVASVADIDAGGVDVSHRGGRAGFVRVRGSELVIPEFRGNNYMNTVGNFLIDPRSALLFLDFATGTLLGLLGRVAVDWNPSVKPVGATFVWRFTTTGAWRLRGALLHRWVLAEQSPTVDRTGDWPPD